MVEGIVVRHSIGVDDRVERGRGARVGWGRRRDQPLVVQEGAAESGLEEIVRDRIILMVFSVEILVDGQGPGVVVALR